MPTILPYSEKLDIAHFQRLFDDMSECYKLFWFQALVDEVCAGNTVITYDTLINDMTADAWYMVSEYRLNLGPKDNLEALVYHAQKAIGLKSSEKRENIISTLSDAQDRELVNFKKILTLNVPYRLQSPFMKDMNRNDWKGSKKELAEKINGFEGIIYSFEKIDGLNSIIRVSEDWAEYINANSEVIRGWIQYNLILYLQRRNPGVPGIPNKLRAPQERKLELVKKYWRTVIDIRPINEIYAEKELDGSEISIDHFVPWSYVAHDELWNLNPTTRSINSSKSNHLPDWNTYFGRLCTLEYDAYGLVWDNDSLHALFDRCLDEHINSTDIRRKLYRPGLSRQEFNTELENIVLPVYKAAQSLGFDSWVLK